MMQKNGVRLGRLMLMAGAGLTCLVVLEAHQKMLGALAPGRSTETTALQQAPAATSERQAPAATSEEGSAAPQQQSLAVDAATPGDRQPNVSTVDPSQLAVNEWQGASFPVENFQAYTSPFGYRLSPYGGYSQEFHYGLDLAAPSGSYIRNWWGGTVVEVSDDSNCGTSVVVESGNWLHIYCHMQGHVETDGGKRYMIDREGGVQIWEGQEVPAGQRIGRVGMTGRTTGPHLHWGLKYSSNWVDPALVLRAMYAGQRTARANDN